MKFKALRLHERQYIAHILTNVHLPQHCNSSLVCMIHLPLDGPWRPLGLVWNNDRKVFFRQCEHDVLHADLSQVEYARNTGALDDLMHICDGCCAMWAAHAGMAGAYASFLSALAAWSTVMNRDGFMPFIEGEFPYGEDRQNRALEGLSREGGMPEPMHGGLSLQALPAAAAQEADAAQGVAPGSGAAADRSGGGAGAIAASAPAQHVVGSLVDEVACQAVSGWNKKECIGVAQHLGSHVYLPHVGAYGYAEIEHLVAIAGMPLGQVQSQYLR